MHIHGEDKTIQIAGTKSPRYVSMSELYSFTVFSLAFQLSIIQLFIAKFILTSQT